MTTEKIISRECHQKSPIYGHVAELFLESEFQHKGNKQTKNAHSQQNLAVSSTATDLENIIIQIPHENGQIKNLDRIVIVRTGTCLLIEKDMLCVFIRVASMRPFY